MSFGFLVGCEMEVVLGAGVGVFSSLVLLALSVFNLEATRAERRGSGPTVGVWEAPGAVESGAMIEVMRD